MERGGEEAAVPLLNLNDILYIVFRHKWKISIFAAAGCIAAAAVFFSQVDEYESHAKLLVKYVLERSGIDPVQGGEDIDSREGRQNMNVVNAEVEILTSWDLAIEVADAINAERNAGSASGASGGEGVSPGDPAVIDPARIKAGVMAKPTGAGNVIRVSYKDTNPELAVRVLQELVTRYFDEHLEIHRSVGAFDLVTQQTDQVRIRLKQTEDELRKLKIQAGIISLPDSMASVNARMSTLKESLMMAEMEYAEQKAIAQAAAPAGAAETAETADAPLAGANAPSGPEVQEFATLRKLLSELRDKNVGLLLRYTSQNHLVVSNEQQIAEAEGRLNELREKYPILDASFAGTNLVALETRIEVLKRQLKELEEEGARLSEFETEIAVLERKRALDAEKYHYFESTLEKARVDETLDSSKIPNISVVQAPCEPIRVSSESIRKIIVALAGGGLALGIGIALFIEMILDRTVKRPLELESRLRMPLLLSVPYIEANGRAPRLMAPKNGDGAGDGLALPLASASAAELSPWEEGHFIRPFSNAIRDRLACYFELNQMRHKPKLVALTGFSEGAGTTSLAVGVAAAFSELGDGNVLLVDMNMGQAEAHPLFKGKPTRSLVEALQTEQNDIHFEEAAQDNLYLATAASPDNGSKQFVAKKLYDLMPGFRASNFDYIIFDMPPLGPTSPTLAMAGFMDKVLLVVDAEKTNRDVLKRRYSELVAAKADVSCIVNKTREHVPSWIHDQA